MKKSRNTNPRKCHIHWRAPSRIFWKTCRGMIPHKTARGQAALDRLKTYEGIPYPYDHKKRMVVPEALKIVRLKDNRKYCNVGELASHMGWTKKDTVDTLEEKRKVKAAKFWELKKKKIDAKDKAKNHKDVQELNKTLSQYGF